jgi:hypothetical protein
MRELILAKIIWYLTHTPGGEPYSQPINYTSLRWKAVALHYDVMVNPSSEKFRATPKNLNTLVITREMLEVLTDEQLCTLFEVVIRRAYIQC